MPPITLSVGARRAISDAVDEVFDRVTARYIGPDAAQRGDKRIYIGHRPDLTLQSLYQAAAQEERTKGDPASIVSLVDTAKGYLDLNRQTTKMRIVRTVEAFLRNAEATGVKTDLKTVLGGQLADVWTSTAAGVTKILDTEATRARNMGTLEGIVKVNAASGIEDPLIYFITVRDGERCEECTKVHLLPDEITPRLWKFSEIEHGYHVRGVDKPSWSGMHPHCRCTPATLMPRYGFDKAGMVTYVGGDHSEWDKQRQGKKP